MNVAFFIFRRPDLTKRVFDVIASAKPSRLLVVADGPRNPAEAELCEATRRVVMDHISWPCEILTNFSPINMGCKQRMSSGLDWVFGQVEDAIILEDDCLPHPTFFPFCQELLDRYRNDERVGSISGEHGLCLREKFPYSYFAARFGSIWGWASWRRAWQVYDLTMSRWPALRDAGWHRQFVQSDAQAALLSRDYDAVYNGQIDTWDHQLGFARLLHDLWSIIPTVNLVSNIGFGADASRTMDDDSGRGNRPTTAMSFPLSHPDELILRKDYDRDYLNQVGVEGASFLHRFWRVIINKHFYGGLIRRTPLLGSVWKRIRLRHASSRQNNL